MTIDPEKLRAIVDWQEFAEHAELILAAAQALDDFELAATHDPGARLRDHADALERGAIA